MTSRRTWWLACVLAGWSAIAVAGEAPPVYVQLVLTFEDHVNLELSEQRLERALRLVEALRAEFPQRDVSCLVQLTGVTAGLLLERRSNGLYDALTRGVASGSLEIGYDGTEEPTPAARPRPNFRGRTTAEARWLARSEALGWFLTEGKHPLTGEEQPGVRGGIARVVDVFGPPRSAWGLGLDLGGDAELVHQLRLLGVDALLPGIPDRDSPLSRHLPGFRGNAAMWAQLVAPGADSAPELFWQDHALRLSDYTVDGSGVVLAHLGKDAMQKAFEGLDPSRPHVMRVRLGDSGIYMKTPFGRRGYLTPLEYAYDNVKLARLPGDAVRTPEEIEAAFAREAEALRWLAGAGLPRRPGSRFVGVDDLRAMTMPDAGFAVSVADLSAAVSEFMARWRAQGETPPSWVRAGSHDLSLADLFGLLVDALSAWAETGSLPDTLTARPLVGPLELGQAGTHASRGVSVGAVARRASELRARLADAGSTPVPSAVVPSRIALDGLDLNAAEFLHVMAEALLAASPDASVEVRPVTTFSTASMALPHGRPGAETGSSWTVKPARLAGLLAAAAPSTPCGDGAPGIGGSVRDPSGARVASARVTVTVAGRVVATTFSDAAGGFLVCGVPRAALTLDVRREGFAPFQRAITVEEPTVARVPVVLALPLLNETVTVTAVRGDVRPASWTPEFVSVADRAAWQDGGDLLLPTSFRRALGLHVQQTSTSQASPYVRGLTGQQVVALVDGIRFNTATWRPGANQYTALLDPAVAERVEVVRGPGATQYGSDSLGGTINVLTRAAGSWTARAASGEVRVGGATADRSVDGEGTGGWTSARVSVFLHAGMRASGDLRAGRGLDSHSVVTRLFELSSSLLGERLDQTGFRQWNGAAKVSVRPAPGHTLGFTWLADEQHGASRYDMLDGGAGNLLHRFDPQALRFASLRYDGGGAGPLDTWSASWSYNAQRDDRTYQNVNNARLGLASDVSAERNRTRAIGGQMSGAFVPAGAHAIRAGAEVYTERVEASREDRSIDPATGVVAAVKDVRPRIPNGAGYDTFGLFAQDVYTAWPDRISFTFGGRYGRFTYRQSAADNPAGAAGPLVPDFAATLDELTGQAGMVIAVARDVHLTVNVARGFRAPNANDFGTIGVSGGGFEISPDEAMRVSGSVLLSGSTTPAQVGELGPERLWSYEAGLRARWSHVSLGAAAFLADLDGMIGRRTVLLPPGAAGTIVGGQVVTRQDPGGAVYTPAASPAVFVRVNGGRVRLRGVDASIDGRVGTALAWSCAGAFVHGMDRATGTPPLIENGLPSAHGMARLRWTSAGGRLWVAAGATWAAPQSRLSENDLQQARIGGRRTPQEIRDFFHNGAVARGLVAGGRLLSTGETLDEVTARVLGGAAWSYLFERMPGFLVFDLGAGWGLGRHGRLTIALENLADTNYRTMGSGVDGAGRSLVVRHAVEF